MQRDFPRRDLTGRQFGEWSVLKFTRYSKFRKALWECECSCGTIREVVAGDLMQHKSLSCGCVTPNKKPKGENSLRAVHTSYRYHAKQRGYEWTITEKEFRDLIKQDCWYCGDPPNNLHTATRANGSIVYSGVDRKDNKLGYTSTNCLPACKKCNRAKSDREFNEFVDWVFKVAHVLESKGIYSCWRDDK